MESEVTYSLDNEQQFWEELNDIVSTNCDAHEEIDNILRSFLAFATRFKEEYLHSEYDVGRCIFGLLQSEVFRSHKEYVRRQLLYGLLQEDDNSTLFLITAFLLFDGRENDDTLEMMKIEGAFPRLVELVQDESILADSGLHRMLLELLYEMSRIQRMTWEDLVSVDDEFVLRLLEIIEGVSDDVNDPYHYTGIRVLLVLNEQYMVVSTTTPEGNRTISLTNRVLKALSTHGHTYKTFGCNLILLLNREVETSLQLLILKLLYLLFQTPLTAEYFYTNDLYVLLDVILRNLLDLPADEPKGVALRHTYLRVLHPLLANSQIRVPPHYKKIELVKMLRMLTQSGNHFAPIDETTVRLVNRCVSVEWLEAEKEVKKNGKVPPAPPTARKRGKAKKLTTATAKEIETGSPEKSSKNVSNGQHELAKRVLGMSLDEAKESTVSVAEVAKQNEKPGVLAPSRERSEK